MDLEKEVINHELWDGLQMPLPAVHPRQMFGIEIAPIAHALASIVVWIGYIQWRIKQWLRAHIQRTDLGKAARQHRLQRRHPARPQPTIPQDKGRGILTELGNGPKKARCLRRQPAFFGWSKKMRGLNWSASMNTYARDFARIPSEPAIDPGRLLRFGKLYWFDEVAQEMQIV